MKPKTLLNLDKTSLTPERSSQSETKHEKITIKTKNDFVITSAEVSECLGISYITFLNWLKAGRFKGVRMIPRSKGSNYKFIKSDFEEWFNKNCYEVD